MRRVSDEHPGPIQRYNVREHAGMYLIASMPLGGAIVAAGTSIGALLDDRDDAISRQVDREMSAMALYGVVTSIIWILVVLAQ